MPRERTLGALASTCSAARGPSSAASQRSRPCSSRSLSGRRPDARGIPRCVAAAAAAADAVPASSSAGWRGPGLERLPRPFPTLVGWIVERPGSRGGEGCCVAGDWGGGSGAGSLRVFAWEHPGVPRRPPAAPRLLCQHRHDARARTPASSGPWPAAAAQTAPHGTRRSRPMPSPPGAQPRPRRGLRGQQVRPRRRRARRAPARRGPPGQPPAVGGSGRCGRAAPASARAPPPVGKLPWLQRQSRTCTCGGGAAACRPAAASAEAQGGARRAAATSPRGSPAVAVMARGSREMLHGWMCRECACAGFERGDRLPGRPRAQWGAGAQHHASHRGKRSSSSSTGALR